MNHLRETKCVLLRPRGTSETFNGVSLFPVQVVYPCEGPNRMFYATALIVCRKGPVNKIPCKQPSPVGRYTSWQFTHGFSGNRY